MIFDEPVVSTDPSRSSSDWVARRNFKRLSLPVSLTMTETETNLRRISNRLCLGSDAPLSAVDDTNSATDPDTVDTDGDTDPAISSPASDRKEPLSSLRSMTRESYEFYGMDDTASLSQYGGGGVGGGGGEGQDKMDNSMVIERLASRDKAKMDGEENKKRCLPDGGRLLGVMYAFTVALVGTALPLREALTKNWLTDYVHAVFLVYVYGVGLIFLLVLEICLIRAAKRRQELLQSAAAAAAAMSKGNQPRVPRTPRTPSAPVSKGIMNMAFEPDPALGRSTRDQLAAQAGRPMWYKRHISLSDLRQMSVVSEHSDGAYIIEPDSHWDFPLPHHTSLYLRIGVTLFGLATMVYDGLLIKQLHEHDSPSSCGRDTLIWPHYIHLAFLLMQTFFLFKHPQIQVTAGKPLVRIGFMHLLATNWCFWVRTLIRETLDNELHYDWKQEQERLDRLNSSTTTITADPICDYEDDILHKAVPYLFPCIMEYSLLAGAAMYNMYSGIGYQLSSDSSDSGSNNNANNTSSAPASRKRNHLTEISFHRTHRGVFLGIVILAGTIVSTIFFFSYLSKSDDDDNVDADDDEDTALLVYSVTDISILGLLIVMTCVAWIQIRRLTYIQFLRGIMLDEALLLVAVGGSVLFHLLRVMPVIDDIIDNDADNTYNILTVAECLLSMVAGILQTAFIVDGVCRFVTTSELWESKPGRGSLTFLLCANLAMWLLRSFQLKQTDIRSDLQEDDYGHLAWVLIQNTCVPFLIFYHYHCSACIAHIWSCAYKKDLVKDPDVTIADVSREFAEKGFIADTSWTHINLEEEQYQQQQNRDSGARRVLHRSPIDVVRIKSPVSEV